MNAAIDVNWRYVTQAISHNHVPVIDEFVKVQDIPPLRELQLPLLYIRTSFIVAHVLKHRVRPEM